MQNVDLLYPQWLSSLEPQSLFLHVPRRWADGARGARVRGIVALETGLDSGGGLFGVCRGRRAGAGGGARSYTGTPSRGAASVRFHRRGQSLGRSRRDRFGARRTRDAEVRHSAAPRAAGAVLPLRHAAGGCHARSGRPARTGGSRRHKTYRLARRPDGWTQPTVESSVRRHSAWTRPSC